MPVLSNSYETLFLHLKKLANLMALKQDNAVEIVRSEMLCVKNRAEQLIWRSGPLLSGERVQRLADLDIYLEMDTIHVKNLTVQRNYVDHFIKQIHRTQVSRKALCYRVFLTTLPKNGFEGFRESYCLEI